MKGILRSVVAILLMACGGGAADNPGPTGSTPPVTAGPAAALSVAAGDGQDAEPASAVAIAPAVLVRDAAGRPVPGATVSFTVDSGGGVVTGNAATSGSDGIARVGAWTMGPAEGRNVLSASVGNLPVVRIVVAARYREAEVVRQTVGPGGGSVQVTTSGALAGFRLDLPSGASSTTRTVVIRTASSSSLVHDTLTRVVSPLITIDLGDSDALQALATVRIPVRLQANEVPIVAIVDSSGRFVRVLGTVAYDATSVTVEGASFSTAMTIPTTTVPIRSALRVPGAQPGQTVVLAQANGSLPPSGGLAFSMTSDLWEFPRLDTPLGPTSLGQAMSAAWYFANKKPQHGALRWRYSLAPDIRTSANVGIRWTAGLSRDLNPFAQRHIVAAVARRAADPALYDVTTFRSVLHATLYSKAPPVLLLVNPNNGQVRPVLSTSWDRSAATLRIADPADPDNAQLGIVWVGGQLQCGGCVVVAGLDYLLPTVDPQWTDVENGTIYQSAFPPVALSYRSMADGGAPFVADTFFLSTDTARVWSAMSTWPHSLPTTIAKATHVQGLHVWSRVGTAWTLEDLQITPDGKLVDYRNYLTPGTQSMNVELGMEVRAVQPPYVPTTGTRWAGFKRYRFMRYDLGVNAVQTGPLTTQFSARINGGPALPPNALYEWAITDSDGTVITTLPGGMSYTYKKVGAYPVVLTVFHAAPDSVPIARVRFTNHVYATQIAPRDVFVPKDSQVTYVVRHQQSHPANAHYRWSFSEGGHTDTYNVASDSTVRYTFDRIGVFKVVVEVTDNNGTRVGKDSTIASVEPRALSAWKFTSMAVSSQVVDPKDPSRPAPQQVCHSCFRDDSLRVMRMASGLNEGGFVHIPRDTVLNGQAAPQGIYILEGTGITRTRLASHLDFQLTHTLAVPPAAGRLLASPWHYKRTPLRAPPLDAMFPESYAETGDHQTGTISGVTYVTNPNSAHGFTSNLRFANIDFSGDVASGTITMMFRRYESGPNNGPVEFMRYHTTVSFTAQRVR